MSEIVCLLIYPLPCCASIACMQAGTENSFLPPPQGSFEIHLKHLKKHLKYILKYTTYFVFEIEFQVLVVFVFVFEI